MNSGLDKMSMKKQELIHIHGLLAQIQNHYEREPGHKIENGKYKEYKQIGAQPTSIHKGPTEHKDAVLSLAAGIAAEMKSAMGKRGDGDGL